MLLDPFSVLIFAANSFSLFARRISIDAVFLLQAECLTSSEYRLAKAPILRRLAGYRIVSPSRDKRKGGLRAILSKLKVHGLRHHSPPRSGM